MCGRRRGSTRATRRRPTLDGVPDRRRRGAVLLAARRVARVPVVLQERAKLVHQALVGEVAHDRDVLDWHRAKPTYGLSAGQSGAVTDSLTVSVDHALVCVTDAPVSEVVARHCTRARTARASCHVHPLLRSERFSCSANFTDWRPPVAVVPALMHHHVELLPSGNPTLRPHADV